jgi:outer membrane protein
MGRRQTRRPPDGIQADGRERWVRQRFLAVRCLRVNTSRHYAGTFELPGNGTGKGKASLKTKRHPFAAAGVLAAALLIHPHASHAQATEPQLTLQETIDRVQKQNPLLVQSAGAVRTAESAQRAAFGAYLPNLSLGSGASLSSTERFNSQTNTTVTGSSDSYSAGLSGSIDLFTGGRRSAEVRRARAEASAAEASLIEQQYAVTLTAKRTFYDVLRGDELIRVAQARIEQARKGLEMAEQRFRLGSATRSDVLRGTLELNQARQSLLQAQSQRRAASFALGRLVGVPGGVGARDPGDAALRPISVSDEELAQLVMDQAPSVRTAEAAVISNDAGVRAARTQYLPTLRLSGGYDWFNQDPGFNGGRRSWSTRLGVSYPLFNGFQREDAVVRAEVQADVAKSFAVDARLFARSELERILATLRQTEQQIPLAEEAVTVAEEDLRVQEQRYTLGASTILEQITSQLNLVQAQTNLVSARFDYQVARAELEALAGRQL